MQLAKSPNLIFRQQGNPQQPFKKSHKRETLNLQTCAIIAPIYFFTIMCHMSRITCNVSLVTFQLLPVTCHLFANTQKQKLNLKCNTNIKRSKKRVLCFPNIAIHTSTKSLQLLVSGRQRRGHFYMYIATTNENLCRSSE